MNFLRVNVPYLIGKPRVMGAIESLGYNTRHNSADSVPTSNLVCIKEVAIRATFCIAGIIYYTCNLITNIQCTRYKYAFNKRFKRIVCQDLYRKKKRQHVMRSTSG